MRSVIGFSLSILIHGSIVAYFISHEVKENKPEPNPIAMQMAMFEITTDAPKPTEEKAKPKLTPTNTPLPVEPVNTIETKQPIPTVETVKQTKPEPIKEKALIIKSKPAVIPKSKRVIKKKVEPKKKITKKKLKSKQVVIKKKTPPKPNLVAKKRIAPKPHQINKKVTRHINQQQRLAQQQRAKAIAQQKRRLLLAQQRARVQAQKKAPQVTPKIKKQAPKRKTIRPKVIGNPQLEGQYGNGIRQRIEQKKVYPRRAKRMRKEGIVQLGFTISRNGAISKLRIVKSSGISSLDKGALKTIHKIGRFPIFPSGLNKTFIDYIIPISYSRRN
jgi:protein TonB